jgi:hypothetical protein
MVDGMRGASLWIVLVALTTALGACSSSSSPEPGDTGGCVTDFSCALNEECEDGGCGPLRPALRTHIQTASCVLRGPLDDSEVTWRATHFDLLIAGLDPDLSRAVNPNVRLFDYVITRFNRFDRPAPKTASQWAAANGYDGEDFYLHYREDTYIPTWEGRTIVPGYPAGMVPGWNPGGGGNPATATGRDQARVVGYYYGPQPWYFANVSHPGYRAFLKYHIEGLMDGTWFYNQKFSSGPLDGVLIDDAIWYPQFGEGLLDHSSEYYGVAVNNEHPFTYAIENLFPGLASDMLNVFGETKEMMPNYGHVLFLDYPNRCAQNIQHTTPWIWGEVWVSYTGTSSPTSGSNRCMSEENDYDNAVRQIILQTRSGGRRIVGARDTASGINGTDRGKLLTLGLYYLIHNPRTYYMYETIVGHDDPNHLSQWAWNPAVDYDIGQPDVIPAGEVDFEGKANTKEHYVFASGPDPVNGSLGYRVYARRFTNALVLVKLMPIGSTTDDTSITTHALDHTYVPLLADGNVGAPVTQVDIRNNEALILIPVN